MDVNDKFMARLNKLLGNIEQTDDARKQMETPNFKGAMLSDRGTPRFDNDKDRDTQFHFEGKSTPGIKSKKSVKFYDDKKKNP